MSNDTASAQTGEAVNGDRPPPADSRKPDAIAREIELTRAELADTIDAIADRISPRRAATRGAQAVKAQVSSVVGRAGGEPAKAIDLDAPAPVAPAAETASGIDPRLLIAGGVVGAVIAFLAVRRMKRS
jgi:hypothetical protein